MIHFSQKMLEELFRSHWDWPVNFWSRNYFTVHWSKAKSHHKMWRFSSEWTKGMWHSDKQTERQLSQKCHFSAGVMCWTVCSYCRVGWAVNNFGFWYGVNRSIFDEHCAKNNFYIFVPSDLDTFGPRICSPVTRVPGWCFRQIWNLFSAISVKSKNRNRKHTDGRTVLGRVAQWNMNW